MSGNRLLSGLTAADFALLEPALQPVDLPIRMLLQARNKRVEQIYFVDSGAASVVANGKRPIEVGMIGSEGMTGIAAILDADARATNETYIQLKGEGRLISTARLLAACQASPTLQSVLLRYAHSFMTQISQTAVANGRNKIDERLARWLLIARDRSDGDELELTHEFLGVMLGVTRPGVTIALQQLERQGWILHRRGCVSILDRNNLEKASKGAYVRPDGE